MRVWVFEVEILRSSSLCVGASEWLTWRCHRLVGDDDVICLPSFVSVAGVLTAGPHGLVTAVMSRELPLPIGIGKGTMSILPLIIETRSWCGQLPPAQHRMSPYPSTQVVELNNPLPAPSAHNPAPNDSAGTCRVWLTRPRG